MHKTRSFKYCFPCNIFQKWDLFYFWMASATLYSTSLYFLEDEGISHARLIPLGTILSGEPLQPNAKEVLEDFCGSHQLMSIYI